MRAKFEGFDKVEESPQFRSIVLDRRASEQNAVFELQLSEVL
jgi:hypothetical protein